MSSFINLFKIYFISFFSICSEEKVETVLKNHECSEVVNYISENEKLEMSTTLKSLDYNNLRVISFTLPNNKLSQLEVDSKIRVLYFRLKKNLETLVYLSELESQFNNKNELTQVIEQYNAIKKSIQLETIEISNELSYYRALQRDACA